ncbi:hypothetical protein CYMTET_50604 [Cymbomonas tetramitiformis]|uniref:G8 domain-containing protein n=1 Tax=Cymbomonas tetramitiformis TaxID=36881 RepID=A0AAE0BPF8_9CHLO|nr:hypothetical protein CYMTET_50604 [Cymbomonas tetramitiformis]
MVRCVAGARLGDSWRELASTPLLPQADQHCKSLPDGVCISTVHFQVRASLYHREGRRPRKPPPPAGSMQPPGSPTALPRACVRTAPYGPAPCLRVDCSRGPAPCLRVTAAALPRACVWTAFCGPAPCLRVDCSPRPCPVPACGLLSAALPRAGSRHCATRIRCVPHLVRPGNTTLMLSLERAGIGSLSRFDHALGEDARFISCIRASVTRSTDNNPVGWSPGAWGACSHECGGGNRTRAVACVDAYGIRQADSSCGAVQLPHTVSKIPEGVEVLLDVSPPRLSALVVEAGASLSIDRPNNASAPPVLLESDVIEVHGVFVLGTPAAPLLRHVVVRLSSRFSSPPFWQNDTSPFATVKTLLVTGPEARLIAQGEAHVAWTRLNATAYPGDSRVVLEHAVTWRAGHRIVVSSTDYYVRDAGVKGNMDEELEVARVEGGGRVVHFTQALKFYHHGETQMYGDTLLDERAEVALLSRNVIIESSDGDAAGAGDSERCDDEPSQTGGPASSGGWGTGREEWARSGLRRVTSEAVWWWRRRGFLDWPMWSFAGSGSWAAQHDVRGPVPRAGLRIVRAMVIAGTGGHRGRRLHSSGCWKVKVREVDGMRFGGGGHVDHADAIGLLDLGAEAGALQYIKNCSIHHTFSRAVGIRATSNATLAFNVAFENPGHAIFLERGDEVHTRVYYNLVLSTRAVVPVTLRLEHHDLHPSAFWIANALQHVQGNVAASSDGFGFWFKMSNGDTGEVLSHPQAVMSALGRFDDNVAHSNRHAGLFLWHNWLPCAPAVAACVPRSLADTIEASSQASISDPASLLNPLEASGAILGPPGYPFEAHCAGEHDAVAPMPRHPDFGDCSARSPNQVMRRFLSYKHAERGYWWGRIAGVLHYDFVFADNNQAVHGDRGGSTVERALYDLAEWAVAFTRLTIIGESRNRGAAAALCRTMRPRVAGHEDSMVGYRCTAYGESAACRVFPRSAEFRINGVTSGAPDGSARLDDTRLFNIPDRCSWFYNTNHKLLEVASGSSLHSSIAETATQDVAYGKEYVIVHGPNEPYCNGRYDRLLVELAFPYRVDLCQDACAARVACKFISFQPNSIGDCRLYDACSRIGYSLAGEGDSAANYNVYTTYRKGMKFAVKDAGNGGVAVIRDMDFQRYHVRGSEPGAYSEPQCASVPYWMSGGSNYTYTCSQTALLYRALRVNLLEGAAAAVAPVLSEAMRGDGRRKRRSLQQQAHPGAAPSAPPASGSGLDFLRYGAGEDVGSRVIGSPAGRALEMEGEGHVTWRGNDGFAVPSNQPMVGQVPALLGKRYLLRLKNTATTLAPLKMQIYLPPRDELWRPRQNYSSGTVLDLWVEIPGNRYISLQRYYHLDSLEQVRLNFDTRDHRLLKYYTWYHAMSCGNNTLVHFQLEKSFYATTGRHEEIGVLLEATLSSHDTPAYREDCSWHNNTIMYPWTDISGPLAEEESRASGAADLGAAFEATIPASDDTVFDSKLHLIVIVAIVIAGTFLLAMLGITLRSLAKLWADPLYALSPAPLPRAPEAIAATAGVDETVSDLQLLTVVRRAAEMEAYSPPPRPAEAKPAVLLAWLDDSPNTSRSASNGAAPEPLVTLKREHAPRQAWGGASTSWVPDNDGGDTAASPIISTQEPSGTQISEIQEQDFPHGSSNPGH